MDSVTWCWNSGRQFLPPLRETHTPPSAKPAYSQLPSVASAVERPDTRPQPAP